MRIQSRFKDYYDFISHQFGSDPSCVYVREPFKTVDIEFSLDQTRGGKSIFNGRLVQKYVQADYCLEYVVADNLAVPGGAMHLVTDLVRLGIYSDIGAAIRAGIRLLIEQNRDSLLAAEARMARRQIVNALQEAEVRKE